MCVSVCREIALHYGDDLHRGEVAVTDEDDANADPSTLRGLGQVHIRVMDRRTMQLGNYFKADRENIHPWKEQYVWQCALCTMLNVCDKWANGTGASEQGCAACARPRPPVPGYCTEEWLKVACSFRLETTVQSLLRNVVPDEIQQLIIRMSRCYLQHSWVVVYPKPEEPLQNIWFGQVTGRVYYLEPNQPDHVAIKEIDNSNDPNRIEWFSVHDKRLAPNVYDAKEVDRVLEARKVSQAKRSLVQTMFDMGDSSHVSLSSALSEAFGSRFSLPQLPEYARRLEEECFSAEAWQAQQEQEKLLEQQRQADRANRLARDRIRQEERRVERERQDEEERQEMEEESDEEEEEDE